MTNHQYLMKACQDDAQRARTARRLPRWVVVAGIVLLTASIAATVIAGAVSPPSPRPAAGYLLVAHDAHFTALFPRKPQRTEKTTRTSPIIFYLADLPGHAVEIICAPVPAPDSFSLNRAVDVIAAAFPGGKALSRHRLTYHGHPAEDAAISVLGNPGQIRVAAFGSAAYIFEGYGITAASFAHDYKILLDTFTPHPYAGTPC